MTAGTQAGPGLDALMAEMPAWGSEFTGTFSNHAPMAITALDRIGGDADRLRDFFDHYRDTKKLLPFGASRAALDADTWTEALGQRDREPDLRAFFAGEVVRRGIDATVRLHLPRLAPGVPASAFHGLMRLAYGLLRRNDEDVAVALGYWAATYFTLPGPTGAAPITEDPAEVLVRTAAIEPLRHLKLHELLWQNMRDAGATPEFRPVVDWLAIGPDTMRRMAGAAIVLFAATQHFAALHVVTGLHWIRIVEPFVDEETVHTLLRRFWQGVAGLVPELGFPSLPDAETVARWRAIAAPDWPVLQAAAARSYDEHDISIAYSAHEEDKAYGDPLYRVAVARRLGLIGDYA